ncbi:hypothetical protein ACRRTK_005597 [Alexandromys fortis]
MLEIRLGFSGGSLSFASYTHTHTHTIPYTTLHTHKDECTSQDLSGTKLSLAFSLDPFCFQPAPLLVR